MSLNPHFSLAELVASQVATRKGIDNTPAAAGGGRRRQPHAPGRAARVCARAGRCAHRHSQRVPLAGTEKLWAGPVIVLTCRAWPPISARPSWWPAPPAPAGGWSPATGMPRARRWRKNRAEAPYCERQSASKTAPSMVWPRQPWRRKSAAMRRRRRPLPRARSMTPPWCRSLARATTCDEAMPADRLLLEGVREMAACIGSGRLRQRPEVPVFTPCVKTMPKPPAYEFDKLEPTATDGEIVLALARDWPRSRKYEAELEALVAGCPQKSLTTPI